MEEKRSAGRPKSDKVYICTPKSATKTYKVELKHSDKGIKSFVKWAFEYYHDPTLEVVVKYRDDQTGKLITHSVWKGDAGKITINDFETATEIFGLDSAVSIALWNAMRNNPNNKYEFDKVSERKTAGEYDKFKKQVWDDKDVIYNQGDADDDPAILRNY